MDDAIVEDNPTPFGFEESKDKNFCTVPRLNTEEGEQEERTSLRAPEDARNGEAVAGEDILGHQLDDDSAQLLIMHEKLSYARTSLLPQLLSVILLQATLCYYIVHETYWKVEAAFPDDIPSTAVIFTRFTVGLLFHITLSGQLAAGLDKMKFALNHGWRFNSMILAWTCGFCEVATTVSVEIILYFLVVLCQDLLEVITSAVALTVLAKMPSILSLELASNQELVRCLVKEVRFAPLRMVKKTTSLKANHNQPLQTPFFTIEKKAQESSALVL